MKVGPVLHINHVNLRRKEVDNSSEIIITFVAVVYL